MPIGTNTPNNKQYATLTGTFTGTVDTIFWIRMNNDNGTVFKWKTKQGSGAWSSLTTVSDHSAQTAKLLTLGMSVTFTRSNLGTYLAGDKWEFTVSPDYRLAPNDTTTSFDRLIPMDKSDEQHLIAINSKSGETAYIENYNTDSPTIIQTQPIPAKATGYVDYVVNNKLAYVGIGKEKSSQVVGFVKNNQWGVSDAEEFERIQEKSYQTVSVSSVSHKVFTDSVMLQGGAGTINDAYLSVGFDYEDNESAFYIYNNNTNKVYKRDLPGTPLAIRICPFLQTSGKINGVAILMEPTNGGYINFMQTYSISDDGTVTTFEKSFNLEAPSGNTSLNKFSDFLMIPRVNNINSNSTIFDLILSAGETTDESSLRDGYLFKVENFKSYNESEFSGSSGGNIEAGDYIPMSPKNSYSGEDKAANMWIEIRSDDGSQQEVGCTNHPTMMQRGNLIHLGYDSNGQNPYIGVTVKLQPIFKYEDSDQDEYGGYEIAIIKPLWWDGYKYWKLKWVTYAVPLDSSGRNACEMMAHMKMSGTTTTSISSSNLQQSNVPAPADAPLFASSAGKSVNDRAMVYSEADGQRIGFYYIQREENVAKLKTINDIETKSGHLSMFPNTGGSTIYNQFANYSSGTTDTAPANILSTNLPSTEDERPYVLSDRQVQMTGMTSASVPAANNSNHITRRDDEGDEYIEQQIGSGSAGSNELSGNAPWFNISTITTNTNKDWLGDASTRKAFYKCSLLYDGFQESALISVIGAYDTGSAITDGLQVPIEIDEEAVVGEQKKISRRITSVILYRADDSTQTSLEPEGLYRFVEEVSIDKFYLQSGKYKFTVQDDGSRGASNEALNGIPETLGSLGVDYTVNASINGYMFIGNCNHPEFADGENVLFRSEPGKYSIFNWSQNFIQLDFIPTALASFVGKLYVFGKNQMCIVNPETLIIEENISGIGCLGPKALKTTSSGLFWLDYNNFYQSSPKIDKIGTTIKKQPQCGWDMITNAEKDLAVVGYDATRQCVLFFFHKTDSSGTDKRCWSYYIPQKRWDLWETTYKIFDTVDGDDGYPILLAEEGRIIKMGAGTSRRNWQWNSKKLTLGTDTNYKKVRVVKLDASSRPSTSIKYQTNDESTYQSGTDVSNNYGSSWTGNAIKVASTYSKLRWVRLKAEGTNGSTTNVKGHSIGIVYKPKKPK
jgi:hypothetical protein